MLNHTIDKMRSELKLSAMAQVIFDQNQNKTLKALDFDERLGLAVDAEIAERDSRKLQRSIRTAKFKTVACPEDIDFQSKRGLNKQVITNLNQCDWIEDGQNVILTGPTGLGKTWLACAFGVQAARKGYSVLYKRLSRLLEELEIAFHDGSLAALRNKISKAKVLILDDWGLAPLTERGRQELLEIIDDRSGSGSLIITSQLPVDAWHDYLGEATIADAILDRVVHRAHIIPLRGDSLRKKQDAQFDMPMGEEQ